MNSSRFRILTVGAVVLAIGAVMAGIGIGTADERQDLGPEASVYAAMTAKAEKAPARFAAAERFLQQFNTDQQDYRDLPVTSSIFDIGAPLSLPALLRESTFVIVGQIESVKFETSQWEQIPMSRITVRIDEVIKGELSIQQRIEVLNIGGPYQGPGTDESGVFLTRSEGVAVPLVGSRVVYSLATDLQSGEMVIYDHNNTFSIENGFVTTDLRSVRAGVARLSEVELIDRLLAAASMP